MISLKNPDADHDEEKDVAIEALIRAQKKIRGAKKTGENNHYDSDYSTFEDVWDACFDALSSEGFAITQAVMSDGSRAWLQTSLVYKNGRLFNSECPLLTHKADMQALGSAITYARRYSLAALVGVTQKDDDGNGADGKGGSPEDKKESTAENEEEKTISSGQVKRLFAIAHSHNSGDRVKSFIGKYGYDSPNKILTKHYSQIISDIEQGA